MEFTYAEIRKGLLKYFKKIEHYKVYRSKINRGVIYFYSSKTEYNVIRVSEQNLALQNDEELNHLVNKMQTSSHHQPKVLLLIINENVQDLKESQSGFWELTTDEKNLKTKLEPLFAQINHLKIESTQNTSFWQRASKIGDQDESAGANEDDEANNLETADINAIQKELKTFAARTSANRLVLTWIMMALFALLPVSGTVVCTLLRLDNLESSLQGLEKLFTGGSHYTLTIAGHQWWRIFSFGFAVPASGFLMNAIVLISAGIALFGLVKYSETVIGIWRTLLAFILAYILTSLFSTIMLPESIVGGILPIVGINLGILVSGIGADTSLKSRFVRMKLTWPVIVLLFFPLFTGGMVQYVPLIVGLTFGAGIMTFIPHAVQHSRTTIVIYGVILATFLLLILIFAFLPRWTPGIDNRIVYTLLSYVEHGFLPDADYANNIMAKIGWSIRFEELGSWGIGIVS